MNFRIKREKTKLNKMPSQLKLSVIIITKDEEKNIERCITSVLDSARNLDKEIILVDSRSKDKTLEIAKKFSPPLKIIQLKKDLPLTASSARNIGFLNSSGKYVQFLDGDMILDKKWIQRAISFLEKSNDKVAAVSGEITQQEETNNPYYKKFTKYLKEKTKLKKDEELELRSLFGAFMIKSSVLKEVGSFNPYLRACEEGELSDRIYAKGYKIILLPYHSARHHVKGEGSYSFKKMLKKKFHFSFSEGQVLRKSLSLPNKEAFLFRLSLYKSHFLFSMFMTVGLFSFSIFFIFSSFQFMQLWFLSLILLFTYLTIQEKGNIKNSFYYFICYLFSWMFFFLGFFSRK
jgi:glycosyltransferase involved in cell wall biosynthesis